MNFELIRSDRSRNIRLKINSSGKIIVSAPRRASLELINHFILSNDKWIERQLHKIRLKKDIYPIIDWGKQLVSYFGLVYEFKFDLNIQHKVVKQDGVILVKPVTLSEKDMRKTLLRWLMNESQNYFEINVPILAEQMGVSYRLIKYKQQSTRWGSCSSGKVLCFNWRLIHFNKEVINYVIIHELSHLIHMDHSTDFWKMVAKYDNSYKQKVAFLKTQVLEIEKI